MGDAMDYRLLGRSGLKVSKLCLGTMNFGDQTDLATATKIVDSARNAGINFIDTADGYADGKSESMVGRILKKDRDDWIVATKVGSSQGTPRRNKGLSRKWMLEAIDDSLRRPSDIPYSAGNAANAERLIGWKAKCGMREVVKMMVEAEMATRGERP